MVSPSITPFFVNAILFSASITLLHLSIASAHEFTVGGPSGWTVPPAQDPDFYNLWASMNRFHVGDLLNFQNGTDSVLVVSSLDKYMQCNTTDLIQEFPPGNSVFQFSRYGFFYFISGEVDHCLAGQRMIVRVMMHPDPNPISRTSLPLSPSPTAATPPRPHPFCSEHFEPCHHSNSTAVMFSAAYGTLGVIAAFIEIADI